MKFVSLLAALSLVASAFAVYVTSADGTKIWAEATGNIVGPVVVFIPGFSCSSLAFSKQWDDPFMNIKLHMLRYDVRGQGMSEQPLTNTSYLSQRFAEDFKAVIDYFGVTDRKPVLFGWSMGGITAADVAAYYGIGLLGGVTLAGSFPFRSMHGQVATEWIMSFIPRLLDTDLAKFGPTAKEFAESCVAFGNKLDQDTKYEWMGALANQNPLVRTLSIPHEQNETALKAASETIPYLVIHGDKDKHVDGTKLKAFMDANFSSVTFMLLNDVGHAPFWDAPIVTNRAIIDFAYGLN